MNSGIVFDIKRYSIHDGPGIRTTVFLKGCPLACQWCHNPESQGLGPELMFWDQRCVRCESCIEACPQAAIHLENKVISTYADRCTCCGTCVEICYADARQLVGQEMTVAQVLTEIERDLAFYDQSGGGVTFSGGEPLAQAGFLQALLRACREKEIHTTLDTCGFAPWETIDGIRHDVDLFLYDLKLMDDSRHRQFTGVSNKSILKNLEMISERGHDIILRVVVIPGVNDYRENLFKTGEFAAALSGLVQVELLPYHAAAAGKYGRLNRHYELSGKTAPPDEELAKMEAYLKGFGLSVKTGA